MPLRTALMSPRNLVDVATLLHPRLPAGAAVEVTTRSVPHSCGSCYAGSFVARLHRCAAVQPHARSR